MVTLLRFCILRFLFLMMFCFPSFVTKSVSPVKVLSRPSKIPFPLILDLKDMRPTPLSRSSKLVGCRRPVTPTTAWGHRLRQVCRHLRSLLIHFTLLSSLLSSLTIHFRMHLQSQLRSRSLMHHLPPWPTLA